MSKEVRDKNNFVIGVCRDDGDRITAMSYKKNSVGFYSKSSNITFDSNGRQYCYGDATDTLIREAENKK